MRTVLFSHIANTYISTPKACFVHLVYQWRKLGTLPSTTNRSTRTLRKRPLSKKGGARWKIPPNFQGEAALAYQGPSVEDYSSKYQLGSAKSKKKAWKGLIELCDTLTNSTPDELEEKLPRLLDVDHTLSFLALDNVLMDGDGYHYRGSDYALFMHPDGRFYPLFRDNNEAFTYGGGPGGFGRQRPFRSSSRQSRPRPTHTCRRGTRCTVQSPSGGTQVARSIPRTTVRPSRATGWIGRRSANSLKRGSSRSSLLSKLMTRRCTDTTSSLTGLDAGSERKPGLKKFFERRGCLPRYICSGETS